MTDDLAALRGRLRRDLKVAIKARQAETTVALRTAIAALDNAEAVEPADDDTASAAGRIAHAASGVGSTDVVRRHLSAEDARAVLVRQLDEYADEADRYQALGQRDAAERLRRQAATLRTYV